MPSVQLACPELLAPLQGKRRSVLSGEITGEIDQKPDPLQRGGGVDILQRSQRGQLIIETRRILHCGLLIGTFRFAHGTRSFRSPASTAPPIDKLQPHRWGHVHKSVSAPLC